MADFQKKTKNQIFELEKQAGAELYPDKDWSNFRDGTFETLLARLVAEVGDMNGMNLDFRANNAYIGSVRVRKDARDIAKNVGYAPVERTAASAELDIVATDDVTIPKGSKFGADNGEIFSTLSELILSSSTSLSGSVLAINANYKQITTRARGDAGELISLATNDVLIEHLTVEVDGVEYEQVSDISTAGSTSNIYIVEYDQLNRVALRFGDGTYGRRLAADAEVIVDVFSGGGPAGNSVGAETIISLLDAFTNSSNVDTISNGDAPSGGAGAQSLASIAAQIPAQLRQMAGLVNSEDSADVIKANLTYIADAVVDAGHTEVNGKYVPTATVIAYPKALTVGSLSLAQAAELATFIGNRGEIGVSWTTDDAYAAPAEIEAEIQLNNRNLSLQKEAEIKAALVDEEGAPFFFDNLGFRRVFTLSSILNAIESVPGINFIRINRFTRIPQALAYGDGYVADSFIDIELGAEAEDGYMQFRATSTTAADASFFRPMLVDTVGTTFVRSASINWIVEEFDFASGADFNDTTGPYIKTNGSSKLEFKQLTRVWENDKWNGSDYNAKHLARVQWVDVNGDTNLAFYHINDTTKPGTFDTVEDSASPISGTGITTLASADNTRIKVQILRDQTNGATGSLLTKQGRQFNITHNDANSLYVSSDPSGLVPIGDRSFVHFNEAPLDATGDSWESYTQSLKARLIPNSALVVGEKCEIYMVPLVADQLFFKHKKEVYTLDKINIVLRFI